VLSFLKLNIESIWQMLFGEIDLQHMLFLHAFSPLNTHLYSNKIAALP